MKIFCISDTHFHHANIIKYCNRPFVSVEEMDRTMINNWNKVVTSDDIVLHLGDFAMTVYNHARAAEAIQAVAEQLNGKKIIIKGNHDHKQIRYVDCGFVAEFYQRLDIGRYCFLHIPNDVPELSKKFRHIFYGHIHEKLLSPEYDAPNASNMCVEWYNYTPRDITDFFNPEELMQLKMLVNVDSIK